MEAHNKSILGFFIRIFEIGLFSNVFYNNNCFD